MARVHHSIGVARGRQASWMASCLLLVACAHGASIQPPATLSVDRVGRFLGVAGALLPSAPDTRCCEYTWQIQTDGADSYHVGFPWKRIESCSDRADVVESFVGEDGAVHSISSDCENREAVIATGYIMFAEEPFLRPEVFTIHRPADDERDVRWKDLEWKFAIEPTKARADSELGFPPQARDAMTRRVAELLPAFEIVAGNPLVLTRLTCQGSLADPSPSLFRWVATFAPRDSKGVYCMVELEPFEGSVAMVSTSMVARKDGAKPQ